MNMRSISICCLFANLACTSRSLEGDTQSRAAAANAEGSVPSIAPEGPSAAATITTTTTTTTTTPVDLGSNRAAYGLSFGLRSDASLPPDTVLMTCHGTPKDLDRTWADSCNPYTGDTLCTRARPILCIHKDSSPAPASGYVFGFYNGWVSGELASTAPVVGTALGSRAHADSLCRDHLGSGWQMAEFHDGNGGWAFVGKRNALLDETIRHWVHINDQRGNCWD